MRASSELLLVLLLAGCATSGATEARTTLGDALPAPVSESEPLPALIRGRVAIVDLWASWCDACKVTMPKLVRLEQSYGSKDLVVAGIGVGETPDSAKRFAEAAGLNYPIYADPDFRFADSLNAREVPTLLVFDKSGTIVKRANELDRSLLALLRSLLDQ